MKKILTLALCALMVLSLSVSVFAADENAFEYNFEDDFEGDFIAIDNSIKFYPKQGNVQIVKFDGDLCAQINHTDFEDISGSMDCYADFVAGGVSTWGVESAYVLEYSIYFETMSEDMSWQMLCSREAAASGTQFQQVGYMNGDGKIYGTGIEEPIGEFTTGKWYTVACALDKANACFSIYLDGVCLAKDLDYTITDNSAAETERIRTAFSAHNGDSVAYIDDIKIYNATEPRNVTVAEPVATTAAPETAAPETTAAAAETTAAATAAQTQAAPSAGTATATADVAVILAAISAITASGAVVLKKKH